MSGDKKNPDLHQEERQEALAQNGALDAFTNMTRIVNPFGGPSVRGFHFGSTSFEGYDLNDMIDIVESADPALVDSAGEALVAARDAIKDAAGELSRNLGKIDWQGEAHTAFSDWAGSLVKTAEGIADYADVIGTQVLAAGSGLASVRKSMPPRDSRTDPKTVADIPEAERVDSNDEYTAAVKAEGHRQEAINQMYRLASFYTVSAGTMASAEEPVFPKMPDVGVPPPLPDYRAPAPPATDQASLTSLNEARTTSQDAASAEVGRQRSGEQQAVLKEPAKPDVLPKQPVGTEINSVGTVPPREAVRPTTAAPPVAAGPAGQFGPVPPVVSSAVPPSLRGTVGRTTGPGGVPAAKIPPSAQGRVGPATRIGPGLVNHSPGATTPGPVGSRGTGPVGRTALPGQAGSQGAGPVGRGIVGGVPRSGGPVPGPVGGVPRGSTGTVGATPPSRSASERTGVVGGRSVTGPAPSSNSSKPPRGTVIGGEGVSGPRTTGQRPGQHGVIGAPSTTSSAGQMPRRPVSHPDGVVGTPQGRVAGTRNTGRPSEGSGAPSGSTSNRSSRAGRARRDKRRGDSSATD
ncbi:hypothetical protein GCM10010415_53430 [Streptomyces atrovirens]|uniref:Uncharacterized protein n=1 Tax=Streptomyces atrovirens TaxID=285556 RepID=A0ABW0DVQ7_9ACTN